MIIKEKEILQYTMKGLSLSYKKKGVNTSFKLRNVIECPFNISYPTFSPIVDKFSIENINHSIDQIKESEDILWKKYKKSSNYHMESKKRGKYSFNFVEDKTIENE